jgi:hypothetical protein
MTSDNLLPRLKRVRKLAHDRWTACCPAHDDTHPSLSIRETSDGTLLLKCFSGCDVADIVQSIGMELSDLFPATLVRHDSRRLHRAFFRDQVFEILRNEAGTVWLIGCDMRAGRDISEADYERLCQAVAKIERIAEASYGY